MLTFKDAGEVTVQLKIEPQDDLRQRPTEAFKEERR